LSADTADFLHDPSWRRIVITRNPYTRAISSYYLILVNKQWHEIKLKRPEYDDDRRMTIGEFFDFLDTEDLETCNIHWRLQTSKSCWVLGAESPEIIRMETLTEKLNNLSDEFNLKLPVKLASVTPKYVGSMDGLDLFNMTRADFLRAMGKDPRNGKILFPSLDIFLSSDIFVRIEKLYGRDIESLGYA
jgi:hypothetical protein